MLGLKLPKKLTKAPKLQVDSKRALRIIQIQGHLIILLILALVGTWMWFARVKNSVDLHPLATEFEPQVRVNIETKVFSGEDNITSAGISRTPFITIYGKIKDFGLLNDALSDLAVTVRGTRVDIIQENGEFAEKVLLQPGQNVIDLLVWWEGTSHHRQHYAVTYLQGPTSTSP